MRTDIDNIVFNYIKSNGYINGVDSVSEADSLLATGVIDSVGILELIAFVEKTFSIRVEDEEIIPDNLDSVSRIAAYIRRKNGEGDGLVAG